VPAALVSLDLLVDFFTDFFWLARAGIERLLHVEMHYPLCCSLN
jgi:hypothetical protein